MTQLMGSICLNRQKNANNGLFVDSFGNITTAFFTMFQDGRQAIYKISMKFWFLHSHIIIFYYLKKN